MADAKFEVRITPLFKPSASWTLAETSNYNDGSVLEIDVADTILVEQFSDLLVEHTLNDGRVGNVTLSMHDALLDDPVFAVAEYECALWVGFWRPGEGVAETVLWGQCNVIDNFDDTETVVLEAQDPYAGKATHHYIRRGDPILNVDSERGRVMQHGDSIRSILDAARNTAAQMVREMPVLGLGDTWVGFYENIGVESMIDFDRGQQVPDLIDQITGGVTGPDIDIVPSWNWPATCYATMRIHDRPTNPAAPGAYELGRNLDPVNPDAPGVGKVVFDRGLGNDLLVSVRRRPQRPSTHVHVLDASHFYRESAADAGSSAKVGAWVEWIEKDTTIQRPHMDGGVRVEPDTTPLREFADAVVRAHGVPVPTFTMTLRPVDTPGMYQYGHPLWAAAVVPPPGTEVIGGDWYIGDYLRVRATAGYRAFSTLCRIVKVTLSQEGSNGLPAVQAEAIPAVGGAPDVDPTGV